MPKCFLLPIEYEQFIQGGDCPYFDDERKASTELLVIKEKKALAYDTLLAYGYRRYADVFYRNVCPNCSACEAMRIEVNEFSMSKSQRRTFNANKDLRVDAHYSQRSDFTEEKVLLYKDYIEKKHSENEKKDFTHYEKELAYQLFAYSNTIEMSWRLDDKLVAVSILDETKNALSSNYFFYDVEHMKRRLGIASVLAEIRYAGIMGKKYYYLGFTIDGIEKMAYKKRFRPYELYLDGLWKGQAAPS